LSLDNDGNVPIYLFGNGQRIVIYVPKNRTKQGLRISTPRKTFDRTKSKLIGVFCCFRLRHFKKFKEISRNFQNVSNRVDAGFWGKTKGFVDILNTTTDINVAIQHNPQQADLLRELARRQRQDNIKKNFRPNVYFWLLDRFIPFITPITHRFTHMSTLTPIAPKTRRCIDYCGVSPGDRGCPTSSELVRKIDEQIESHPPRALTFVEQQWSDYWLKRSLMDALNSFKMELWDTINNPRRISNNQNRGRLDWDTLFSVDQSGILHRQQIAKHGGYNDRMGRPRNPLEMLFICGETFG